MSMCKKESWYLLATSYVLPWVQGSLLIIFGKKTQNLIKKKSTLNTDKKKFLKISFLTLKKTAMRLRTQL